MSEPKLCYIEGNFAFFTTQELSKQWGDDWNDAPYEHNAGWPNEWRERNGLPKWEIVKVAFRYGTLEPACSGHHNSPWSVEQINAGVRPWLLTPSYESEQVSIPAGVTRAEFRRLVKLAHGEVYGAFTEVEKQTLEVAADFIEQGGIQGANLIRDMIRS